MPSITVNIPNIGTTTYFSFKEPMSVVVKNKLNVATNKIKLTVVSVISMKDTIRNDLRDPYSDVYVPANISEAEYKKDLVDNIPIISFKFIDSRNVERYIRVPLNYIGEISNVTNIEYINKLILVDLNRLPVEQDVTEFFSDIKDYIETRYGIEPILKEVSIGEPELVDMSDHILRETVRKNMVSVHKTVHVKLEETELKYNQLVDRIQVLGISLS